MKYKIIKPIAKIGAIKGSGSEYTGTFPIVVSNANFTIAIDTSTLQKWNGYETTKQDLLTQNSVVTLDKIITNEVQTITENVYDFTNGQWLLNKFKLETKKGLEFSSWSDNIASKFWYVSFGHEVPNDQTSDTNIRMQSTTLTWNSKPILTSDSLTSINDDIATIKSEQTIQDNKITTNSTNITNIVEGLRTSTLVNYKGEWAQGNVAKLGEIWSYQTKLYLCKVATTTNLPTNETDFDLISSFEVNLDNYYTKLEIDNLLANYITTTSINTYLSNYYTKQEIDTKFTNYYTIPDLNRQMGEVIDLVNIKLNSAWNPLTNLVYQGPYLDIRFNAPINATEFAFSGRFRDANGYYACGGTFMNTSETIYIPTYKNGANEIYVSQLQTNGNQKILRVFNPVGNPVNGPAIADTFKVFWR